MKKLFIAFFCASLAFAGWDGLNHVNPYNQNGFTAREIHQARSGFFIFSGLGLTGYSVIKGVKDFTNTFESAIERSNNSFLNATKLTLRAMPKKQFLIAPALLALTVQHYQDEKEIRKRKEGLDRIFAEWRRSL